MGRRKTPPEKLDYRAWPIVDESSLKGRELKRYLKLAAAVRAACDGMLSGEITRRFGVGKTLLNYYVSERCTQVHPDGRLRGFRALVKSDTREHYVRKAPVEPGPNGEGCAGAFMLLLSECPKTVKWLKRRLRPDDGTQVQAAGLNLAQIHIEFLDQLRKEGRRPDQYPFNTEEHQQGYGAFCAYVRRCIEEGDDEAAQARYGQEAVQAPGRNSGMQGLFTPLISYARTAYDEWELPAIATVTFEIEGVEVTIPTERIWFCPIVDFRSVAVLGYSISLPASFGAIQLLQAFENSIHPPARIVHEAFKDLEPLVDEGLPAAVLPAARGRRIAVLIVDNHCTHLAGRVVDELRERTGVSISFGKVHSWIGRYVVEGLFAQFQTSIGELPSTTGSGPDDPAVQDPVGKALRYHITLDDLHALMDQLVCRHNAQRRMALMTATPNEIIARDWGEKSRMEILPRFTDSFIERPLLAVEIEYPTVCGDRATDREPYVEIDGAKYTNSLLRHSWSMIGQKLKVLIWGDIRTVLAFRLDGTEFGKLSCGGFWSRTPHTRQTRKEINALDRVNRHHKRSSDPVTHYIGDLARSAAAKVHGKRRVTIPREGRKLVGALSVPGGPADPPGFTHRLKLPKPAKKAYATPRNRGAFYSPGSNK